MAAINVFEILNIPRAEDPHDRMVAWLCNPDAGHGISDLPRAIISELWKRDCAEKIRLVHRPFKLRDDSWPDVAVEFDRALLVIENKVNPSALREGQLELQHDLARARQKEAPLFHCVLCPDRMADGGIQLDSHAFRVLRYSSLMDLIEVRKEQLVSDAKPIVEQYVAFVRNTLLQPRPSDVKFASTKLIASRNSSRVEPWDEPSFVSTAEKIGGPDLATAQKDLLELLVEMQDIQPHFESTGQKEVTYTVRLANSDLEPLLWIYADGRIFVRWHSFRKAGHPSAAERMKSIWSPYVTGPGNDQGSNTIDRIGVLKPDVIARLLQQTAASAARSIGV